MADIHNAVGRVSLDDKAGVAVTTGYQLPGSDRASSDNEKGSQIVETVKPLYVKEDGDIDEYGIFAPFDDLPEETGRYVTVRAMLVGIICGCLVNASNLYLGLKTGWTFSANLFGTIVGFGVLKPISRAVPKHFPILGGDFGPRENNIVQTAATAAGGLSSVFVSGLPALYQLGLLSTPKEDFARIVTLTLVGGYFGFAFATPLRKFFIVHVARELRLVFPTPTATAMTIRSMHAYATGEALAKTKMIALSVSFAIAVVQRVVSQYAPGILYDWHFFTWCHIWSGYNSPAAMAVESWGWFIEWTPAFIGGGMLVGLNTAISFWSGSLIAWGIIGPVLVKTNTAFGVQHAPDDEHWSDYWSYSSLNSKASSPDTPSPRYWMLFPGVLLMITVSFVELAFQWRVFIHVTQALYRAIIASASGLLVSRGKNVPAWMNVQQEKARIAAADEPEECCPPEELVKWWMWAPLLVLTIILSCVVMGVQFDMPVGMTLLSVFLAFFFSFLAVQCAGVTDITPLTAASKASQIILGGATKGEHWPIAQAQRLNLLGGSLASAGANQASDLVGDFRVGYLLRTSPTQQWVAQGVGTLAAVFLAPGLFVLFMTAYPCILDLNAETCPFSAPSVSAWRATTVAMTDPSFPVPPSSGYFAIAISVFGAAMIAIRETMYKGKYAKYRVYHPNMMCWGLAFVLPETVYGTAMVIGALPSYFWQKRRPASWEVYGFAIAAGLIAGEGIGGVVNAIFQLVGIAGPSPYGTNVACPLDSC